MFIFHCFALLRNIKCFRQNDGLMHYRASVFIDLIWYVFKINISVSNNEHNTLYDDKHILLIIPLIITLN